jgi:hypothetical protein
MAPPAPVPNVMVGDGGMPLAVASVPTPAPTPVVSSGRKRPTKLMWALIAVIVLMAGVAIWYFGYFTNPSVIYGQSLKNTSKGYDKLITYVDTQTATANKSYAGNGTYSVKLGGFSTDGKIALKGGGDNAELTFDVGLEATRVNADIRTISENGNTPDIYVKAANIKGLGTVLGIPQLDANLAKLDNSWVVIDHTLIDNLSSAATAQADASSMQPPSRDQLLDEARAFGKVNQQYLFSTAKDKAVTKVVKKYGTETINGRKTYHYKVALQPDNVKKYIYAQRDALKTSTLNEWLTKNKYDKEVYASFDDAANSTKNIKSTDTYDVWVDASKRVVYKVRFSEKKNPATNYVDVGLDYQGGNVFPFFISGKSKTEFDGGSTMTTYAFTTTLDTKSGNTNFKFNLKAVGTDPGGVSANFNLKPSATVVKIVKPSGAQPLSQVLSELGLNDTFNQYTDSTDFSGINP